MRLAHVGSGDESLHEVLGHLSIHRGEKIVHPSGDAGYYLRDFVVQRVDP